MLRRLRSAIHRAVRRNPGQQLGRFAGPSLPVASTMGVTQRPLYLTAAEHAAWSQARYALQQFHSENP